MTVAEIASLAAVAVTVYGIYSQRRNRTSDAYSVLLNALKTSGQTIDDLMKMIADVPKMRQEIEELKREREDWKIGIGLLLGQIVDAQIVPTWIPDGVEIPKAKVDSHNRRGF